jgi:hypothetical protein
VVVLNIVVGTVVGMLDVVPFVGAIAGVFVTFYRVYRGMAPGRRVRGGGRRRRRRRRGRHRTDRGPIAEPPRRGTGRAGGLAPAARPSRED